jgi:hypothetical protein
MEMEKEYRKYAEDEGRIPVYGTQMSERCPDGDTVFQSESIISAIRIDRTFLTFV